MNHAAFIIAATHSGCGKTTFSLGLMRALRERNIRVQPFKCGPDYIDTQFHAVATGSPSINLDAFMCSEPHIKQQFCKYDATANVSIVEGVMGMFDGYAKEQGSSYHLATILQLPIVLLVNAASTAYSVGATIYGFRHFMADANIVGVVFNRVGSENHYALLQEACREAGVECLGYIAKDKTLETPSRHLGLSLDAKEKMNDFIERAKEAVAMHVDIDRLLQLTTKEQSVYANTPMAHDRQPLRIAVAQDEAFNFIYPENIEALQNHPRHRGIITCFSPIHDDVLPTADLIYLPGGYPELYAHELEKNHAMRHAINTFAANGGKILGECGGMIYLCQQLDGKEMCGVLPMRCTMNNAKLTLGYRRVETKDAVFYGHEFHYSQLTDASLLPSMAQQYNVKGKPVDTPVYRQGNTIATYTHLYWAETDILKLWNL